MKNKERRDKKQRQYTAFISYSHQDDKWGKWLHKSLEQYRVPKALVGKKNRDGSVPKTLFPIFRDREELPTSTDLGAMIHNVLNHSLYLIVICSPSSARSHWVNEEILAFKRMGKENKILAVIVDGEPNASDNPLREEEECFPPALRYKIGKDGLLSDQRTEPVAADIRPFADGRKNAKIKLIAGILGVDYDELRQRQKQRTLVRIAFWSLFMAIAACVFLHFYYDYKKQYRQKQCEALAAFGDAALADGRAREAEAWFASALSLGDSPQERIRLLNARIKGYLWRYSIPIRGPVSQMVISPDGKTLALGTRRSIMVMDALSGKIRHVFPKNGMQVFQFDCQGKRLAAAGKSEVKVWDLSRGEIMASIPVICPKDAEEYSEEVNAINFNVDMCNGFSSLSFQSNGRQLAVAGLFGIIWLLDIDTNKVKLIRDDNPSGIENIADIQFGDNSKYIYIGVNKRMGAALLKLNLSSLKEERLSGFKDSILKIKTTTPGSLLILTRGQIHVMRDRHVKTFQRNSPDGLFYLDDGGCSVAEWTENGPKATESAFGNVIKMKDIQAKATNFSWHDEDGIVAFTDKANRLHVWQRVRDDKLVGLTTIFKDHECFSLNPVKNIIATKYADEEVCIKRMEGMDKQSVLIGSRDLSGNMHFSRNGSKFCGISGTNGFKVWKTSSGEQIKTSQWEDLLGTDAECFLGPNGNKIVCTVPVEKENGGDDDNWQYQVIICDLVSGEFQKSFQTEGKIFGIVFNRDGDQLGISAHDNVYVWDINKRYMILKMNPEEYFDPYEQAYRNIRFVSNGKYLFSCANWVDPLRYHREITITDISDKSIVYQKYSENVGPEFPLQYAFNEKTDKLAIMDSDTTDLDVLSFHNAGMDLKKIAHMKSKGVVEFCLNDKNVMLGTETGSVLSVPFDEPDRTDKTYQQKESIKAMTCSSNGRLIASWDKNNELIIRDIVAGKVLIRLGEMKNMENMRFSKDGRFLIMLGKADNINARVLDLKRLETFMSGDAVLFESITRKRTGLSRLKDKLSRTDAKRL